MRRSQRQTGRDRPFCCHPLTRAALERRHAAAAACPPHGELHGVCIDLIAGQTRLTEWKLSGVRGAGRVRRAAACHPWRQRRRVRTALLLLPHRDSDAARASSDRAHVVPMHRMQRLRPSGTSAGRPFRSSDVRHPGRSRPGDSGSASSWPRATSARGVAWGAALAGSLLRSHQGVTTLHALPCRRRRCLVRAGCGRRRPTAPSARPWR